MRNTVVLGRGVAWIPGQRIRIRYRIRYVSRNSVSVGAGRAGADTSRMRAGAPKKLSFKLRAAGGRPAALRPGSTHRAPWAWSGSADGDGPSVSGPRSAPDRMTDLRGCVNKPRPGARWALAGRSLGADVI